MNPSALEPTRAEPSSRLAYVDESMRRVDSATVCYLMAATILREWEREALREAIRPLARATTQRVHWRDEQLAAKEVMVKTIVDLDVEAVVVLGAMIDHTKQERARQQVLKNLLFELDQRGVLHAQLESRHSERDLYDVKSIGRFRNAKYVSARLTVSHGQPLQEPLLWLPDIIAGVVGDHRCGHNALFNDLRESVDVHDLGPI